MSIKSTIIARYIFLLICATLLCMPTYGVGFYAQDALRFHRLTVNEGLPQNSVYSIVKDKYGFMWFGTWGGAVRYDGYSCRVFRADENDPTALPNNRIIAIVKDSKENIWIETGHPNYLYKFDYNYERFISFQLKSAPLEVVELIELSKTNFLLPVENDTYIWETDGRSIRQLYKNTRKVSMIYQPDLSNPFSLSDNQINRLYLGDDNILWVGTQNGGVNYANLNVKPFQYYFADRSGGGLVENVVRAVTVDLKGQIWVGSGSQGITIVDRSTGAKRFRILGADVLRDPEVRALYTDKEGLVWIGTKTGLLYYNPATDSFHYPTLKDCIPNVYSLFQDSKGNMWIGTLIGLARYDRKRDVFECIDPTFSTGGTFIRTIIEDQAGNLWVGTEDEGVTKLIPQANGEHPFKAIRYTHQQGKVNSLRNNQVYSIAEDYAGMIWIATNAGLSRLNPFDHSFTHFSVRNGLADDITMGVLFDGDESVWVSHKKGLSRINVNTFEIQNFNKFDGLQGFEFSQSACYLDKKTGEMLFGGVNGLNVFLPHQIRVNTTKPVVVLTRLSVMHQKLYPGSVLNNRVILERSLQSTSEINLTWRERTFLFEFAALHFNNPTGTKYRYRLRGYDSDWIYTDAFSRTASYSNLPYGSYVFEVLAASSDGLWSDEPATILVNVLSPWWLSWWAKTFYALLIVGLLWFVYRYIAARIEFRQRLFEERVKNEKNEELMNAKLQFFFELSHEFRTPLTLIIDPLDQMIAGKTDEKQAHYYLNVMNRNARQLLELINQLLDFRKIQSKSLSMEFVQAELIMFIRNAAAAFEHKASEKNIIFSVQSSHDPIIVDFDIDKMGKIINNLLSNAFKFTPRYGEIAVVVSIDEKSPDKVVICVRDNGIGIPPEHHAHIFDMFYRVPGAGNTSQGSGIGLAFSKELVQLHQGEISVENNHGGGTCFRIVMPIRQETAVVRQYDFPVRYGNAVSPVQHDFTGQDDELPLLLFVDDNQDIREYFKINFGKEFRVITFSNGMEAFNKAVETIPDLIISDIMMQGVDGFQLCSLLKSEKNTSHIPLILLTARQADVSRIEGYQMGADGYVTKPFSTEVLNARIRNLLEQRTRLREQFAIGSTTKLPNISVNITDEFFLKKIVALIEDRIEDSELDSEQLAIILKMSRSQLYRKIKALTNRTVHDFIISVRMNKAKELLLSGECSIADTAYRLGFTLPTNFTRTFTKHFGMSPSKFVKQHKG